MWVPGRVLKDATDPDMSQHMADTLLRPGLLPPKLPARDMACHWTAVYMAASQQVRSCVLDSLCIPFRVDESMVQVHIKLYQFANRGHQHMVNPSRKLSAMLTALPSGAVLVFQKCRERIEPVPAPCAGASSADGQACCA